MTTEQILEIAKLPSQRYVKDGIFMDVKWKPNCDNGYFAAGNDWSNILRGLIGKISYIHLVSSGWRRV